jgi:hypothetical protein
MGYRSTVSYVIAFEKMEDRQAYIDMIRVKKDSRMIEALGDCHIPKRDATIFYYQTDTKWYESYPDVEAHTSLYKDARAMFGDAVDYKFVRVGEETEDIEEDSTHGDLLENVEVYAVTTIETPYDKDYRDIVKESDDA